MQEDKDEMNVSILSEEDNGISQMDSNLADNRPNEDVSFRRPSENIGKLNDTRPFDFKDGDGKNYGSNYFGNTSL